MALCERVQQAVADRDDYLYVWVDGIHREVRLEQDKVCLLVMIGVRADGSKELIALDLIESAQSRWRAVNAPHLVALVRAGATLSHQTTVQLDSFWGRLETIRLSALESIRAQQNQTHWTARFRA